MRWGEAEIEESVQFWEAGPVAPVFCVPAWKQDGEYGMSSTSNPHIGRYRGGLI